MSQLEEVLIMAHATSGSKPPKSRRNEHRRWTPQEVRRLRGLARGNTPTRVTGLKLGRSEHAVLFNPSPLAPFCPLRPRIIKLRGRYRSALSRLFPAFIFRSGGNLGGNPQNRPHTPRRRTPHAHSRATAAPSPAAL